MCVIIIQLVPAQCPMTVPEARKNAEVRCTFAFLPQSSQDGRRMQVSTAVGAEVARGASGC